MGTFGPRSLVALLFVGLLCVPVAFADHPQEQGEKPSARGEYRQSEIYSVGFDGVTPDNSSFTLRLPSASTVYSASVDLEGRPVIGPPQDVICDFSGDDPGFVAYSGTYTKNAPGAAKPASFAGTQLQSSELSRIAYPDATYYEQWAYSWNGEYGYQHFKFKLPLDIVSNLTVSWAGYSGYRSGTYGGYGTSSAYLWNNQSLGWEYIGNVSGGPRTVSKWFNGSDYVDGTGCVHVLALTKSGWAYYSNYAYNNMDTDYVNVTASGRVLIYPKNPSMDIGANGRTEWSLTENKFNYAVYVGDSTLANELQSLVKNAPGRYTDIKVRFRSSSAGFINITNFTVAYNAPPWCRGIPDTFHIAEDAPAAKLIDLARYFEDDQDRLKYEVVFEEDSKKLDAELNGDGQSLDFKLPAKNWWGRLQFRVRATDPEDPPLWRESNLFNVTVDPVNDPPVLGPTPRQTALQGNPLRIAATARDVDMELDPAEKVRFSDNCSLFDIDPASGVIQFTPKQDQVGIYNVGITATDMAGASDSRNFTLEVQDAEDPPLLAPLANQTAAEGQPFSLTVQASDPDLPYGDSLGFSDDCALFQIDPSTGQISFTPAPRDVGAHRVTITVTDARGGSDARTFILSIYNSIGSFDHAPSIEPISDQNASEGQLFGLSVKASDPDLFYGDSLNFSDDCPLFEIDTASGKISFTPTMRDAGTYRVNVTVRDREGLSAVTGFNLTVPRINHAPAIPSISLPRGANATIGSGFALVASADDPDGDTLTFTWKDGDEVLGTGPEVVINFSYAGSYTITVVASDGQYEQISEISLEVSEPPKIAQNGGHGAPGFEAVLACGALALAVIALDRKRRG